MTTIQDQLDRTMRRAQAEAMIAERYPDAKLDCLTSNAQVLMSRRVLHETTQLDVMSDQAITVALCTVVEDTKVYYAGTMQLRDALKHFQDRDPEGYLRFVKAVADGFEQREQ